MFTSRCGIGTIRPRQECANVSTRPTSLLSIEASLVRHSDVPLDSSFPVQGSPDMRYALLLHYPQPAVSNISEDDLKAGMAAFQAYAKALDDAGVLRSAEVLQTIASATSVTMKRGTLHVQDGPFADTKEAFAGIFMLDVADLDAALAWAERCPAAWWGTVEIRPAAKSYVNGAWRNEP
jgi:hypothetical protein